MKDSFRKYIRKYRLQIVGHLVRIALCENIPVAYIYVELIIAYWDIPQVTC